MPNPKNEERTAFVIASRKRGRTYEEIAIDHEVAGYGPISRQRIAQIIQRDAPELLGKARKKG